MARRKAAALAAPFQGRRRIVEIAAFSWEGAGRLNPGTAGHLVGHLYFHHGDDSGFVREPW